MSVEQDVQAYWRICQATTGYSGEAIPVKDRVEFLNLCLERGPDSLRNASAETLKRHYSNVAFVGLSSFNGGAA